MHGQHSTPVYVDLDGTLVHTDLLIETALLFVTRHPFQAYRLVPWLARGKAQLKARLAERVALDPATLPYNLPLLEHLGQLARHGAPLFLATAANERYASEIARHLGIFRGVLASDERLNLAGASKLEAIERSAGGSFIYAGNGSADVPIWARSAGALVVDAPAAVQEKIRRLQVPVLATFDRTVARWPALLRAMRPHQWLKNVLVLLPILPIAGSQPLVPMLAQAFAAFVGFSLCASAVYVLNDITDMAADRRHPRKRLRPFATGELSPVHGLLAAPLLLVAAAFVAQALGAVFTLVLALYFVATSAYTLGLKRYPVADVLVLAGLYTLRVLGGAAAIRVVPSFWILAFSMFMFFSLALAKRYIELDTMSAAKTSDERARGYRVQDMPAIQAMGVASGYMAVLVVALYINSPDIVGRYGQVSVLWGLCPVILFWVSRVWLKASRSEMHDDPVVFALSDRLSLLATAAAIGVVLMAIAG